MNNKWPTRTITIPDYGWRLKVNEPTIAELEWLRTVDIGQEWESYKKLLVDLIPEWDACDRHGEPLPPPATDNIEMIPPSALAAIVVAIRREAVTPYDPKGASESMPITAQKPEGDQ